MRAHRFPLRHGAGRLSRLTLLLLASACGEKPSFEDMYESQRAVQQTLDQTAAIEGPGAPPITGIVAATEPAPAPGSGPSTPPGTTPLPGEGGMPPQNPVPPGTEPPIDLPPPGMPSPKRKIVTEMSFPADRVLKGSVLKEFGEPFFIHEFTLQRAYHNKLRRVQQASRPTYTDRFEQEPTGMAQTERFDQVADRKLDILVVVDDSPSMKDNQKNLAGKLEPLLAYIAKSDWQIGVTTTGCEKQCLRALIKKEDADARSKYAAAVMPGTHGAIVERGILNSVRALSAECLQETWVRPDSTVAVLFVSDEDNCSNGKQCKNAPYAEGSYLVNYLASIRDPGKNARVYGLVWPPNVPQDQCKAGKHQANIYAEVIKQTKGIYGSICDADYTKTLMQISKDMMESLNSTFTLKYKPDPKTVRVFLDNTEITKGFTVTGNMVEISPPPADGVRVTINYRFDVRPPNTTFKLRFPPYEGKTSVTVNGMAISPNDYIVDMTVPSIDFILPPPIGAKVAVTYSGDVTLNQDFPFNDEIKQGTLVVKVNGMPTTDYTIDVMRGRIVFNTPPDEGARIELTYLAVGAPIYNYPFMAPPGTPPDLVAFDSTTLQPIRVAYANGVMMVNPDDYMEGRKVSVRFDNTSPRTYDVILPQAPIMGTLEAIGGQQVCRVPQLEVMGNVVSVRNCNFADNVAQVLVNYDFVAATYQEFTLNVEKVPGPGDYQEWFVWVNDLLRTDYTRTGNVIRFPMPLPAGSIVRIQLIQEDN